MSFDSGFIDLRLNRQETESEDSFWPSFTDIMTVIVMIFLLAMVILLLRNMELVSQLRATIEAERAAAELARTTGEQKESLYLKLVSTENELSMLRLQLMRLEEQREQQEIAIASQQRQIATLTTERDTLLRHITTEKTQSAQLKDQLADSKRNLDNLRLDQQRLTQRHTIASDELSELRVAYTEQQQELDRIRAGSRLTDQKLASLEGNYAQLKVQYDKLVRPARTPKGKYVIEVRYFRKQGVDHIDYKRPEDSEFTTVTRKQLDRVLTSLKKQHPKKLYIKVIFPKNSGLSYNQAWKFTTHLHATYDYYFQEDEKQPNNAD